jgi:hypothetical protein
MAIRDVLVARIRLAVTRAVMVLIWMKWMGI